VLTTPPAMAPGEEDLPAADEPARPVLMPFVSVAVGAAEGPVSIPAVVEVLLVVFLCW